MRVLMFGWEFPPFHNGGLGVACQGLVQGLTKKNVEICFVLPDDGSIAHPVSGDTKVIRLTNVKISRIASPLHEYATSSEYLSHAVEKKTAPEHTVHAAQPMLRKGTLFDEVKRYAREAVQVIKKENFDVIHAHDWLTYEAGMVAKQMTGKPLVVHVHATEIDRTGGNGVNQPVYDIERAGMHAADAVIAVSNFTKQTIIKHYGVPAQKVHVVHNAVDLAFPRREKSRIGNNKIVLFLGRITLQKGPDYFVAAAKRVLEHMKNVIFVVSGKGDMEQRIVESAARMNIGDRILFTGWLTGEDLNTVYSNADVYVMPSVSEPFGIAPLEAMARNVPVIISKQSGVSEVVNHCLKIDFWDIDQMADGIISLLKYPELHQCMARSGKQEVQSLSWDTQAEKCLAVYRGAKHG